MIESYVARLLIGLGAVIIIFIAAIVNIADCYEPPSSTVSSDCNCTDWVTWSDAINNPSPDSITCQYPQVSSVVCVCVCVCEGGGG